MNTGSMIYRSDPQILEFLDLVRKCGKANPGHSEQDCIRDVVGVNNDPKEHPVVSKKWAKRFTYVPQYKINGFPPEINCYDKESGAWKEGDFVIHFAGAWAHLTMDDPTGFLMRKYEKFVTN
jgi:mannan polymerase II complex MNN10 subunit